MIIVHKFKPKGHGGKGTAKLEFDFYKNCYYENRGERFYLPTPFNDVQEIKPQNNNDIKPIETAPF